MCTYTDRKNDWIENLIVNITFVMYTIIRILILKTNFLNLSTAAAMYRVTRYMNVFVAFCNASLHRLKLLTFGNNES